MPLTFTPPGLTNISPGTEVTTEPRVNVAEFGDGYIQRSGDGLNSVYDEYNIVIEGLLFDEAETVNTFFRDHKGYIHFLWTPPGETAARKWICNRWAKSFPSPTSVAIRATFREVFDP